MEEMCLTFAEETLLTLLNVHAGLAFWDPQSKIWAEKKEKTRNKDNTEEESINIWGEDPATKSDEFLEKFQTAFDPPPSFLEDYIAIFL